MEFSTLDYVIFCTYILGIIAYGLYLSFKEKNESASEYFLAGNSLPWWAVGGSLIASNISAEQMIAMSGSGFELGLAIASYEFMAAATLIVVAKWLMPLFLENKIQTMPQFLEKRFDHRVRTGLAIFWILLFVFVNVTSLFYLGSLALNSILGIPLIYSIIGLAIYAAALAVFGGLKAVVWTDVIQVVVLIGGGTLASILILNHVSDGDGVWSGLKTLYERAPEKFKMIFDKSDTYISTQDGSEQSAYALLPGLGVVIGGLWIANLYYWGFNQYIIQRALAAKNIKESQKGLVFAAMIKLFVPFIVVIPGIAAFVMGADLSRADDAYPWLINNYIGSGFKGIVVAAIVAAIGSSLCSMINSASTIYTLDIHKALFNPAISEKQTVKVGRIVTTIVLICGALMTPILRNFGQIFQYIQEYTGFISPGILVVFLFGLFWKKATTQGALAAIFLAIPLSLGLKHFFGEVAFMHRMGISFLVLSLIVVVVSLWGKKDADPKEISMPEGIFRTSRAFNFMSLIVLGILAVIYAAFW